MLQHKNRFFRRVYWTQQPTFANGLTQDDIVQEKLRQLFGVAKRLPFGAVMQASDCDCENLTTFFITCHFTHCNSFYFVSKVKVKKIHNFASFFDNEKTLKTFHDILQHTLNSRPTRKRGDCAKIGIHRLSVMFNVCGPIRCSTFGKHISKSATGEKKNKKIILTLKWQWKVLKRLWN